MFVLLQLVYQLFTTSVTPVGEDVKIVMQMAEEAVRAQERDPYTVFANRVKELNYGNSYFFRVRLISVLILLIQDMPGSNLGLISSSVAH